MINIIILVIAIILLIINILNWLMINYIMTFVVKAKETIWVFEAIKAAEIKSLGGNNE